MMHTKNFRFLVIPTLFAFYQQPAFFHLFANRCECRFPSIFRRFINASYRTVFSFMRWSVQKLFMAMLTSIFYGAFLIHGFMIALRAAIFSFICPTSYMRKFASTFLTDCGKLLPRIQRHTASATIESRIFSIVCHSKRNLTVFARFGYSFTGSSHAAH